MWCFVCNYDYSIVFVSNFSHINTLIVIIKNRLNRELLSVSLHKKPRKTQNHEHDEVTLLNSRFLGSYTPCHFAPVFVL